MESCKGVNELSHVNSIVHEHGPQSLFYTVRCNDRYHLRHGEQSYECKDGQWFPQIFCDAKDSIEIWETLHRYGKALYALRKLYAMIACGTRIESSDSLTVQTNDIRFIDIFYIELKAKAL